MSGSVARELMRVQLLDVLLKIETEVGGVATEGASVGLAARVDDGVTLTVFDGAERFATYCAHMLLH